MKVRITPKQNTIKRKVRAVRTGTSTVRTGGEELEGGMMAGSEAGGTMDKKDVSKKPNHVPHPVDELEKIEPVLDAKLKDVDPRRLAKLRRIARLERDLCGEDQW